MHAAEWVVRAIFIALVVGTSVVYLYAPAMNRRFFFGVELEDSLRESPAGRELSRRYRRGASLLGLFSVALMVATAVVLRVEAWGLVGSGILLLQLGALIRLFAVLHGEARELARRHGLAVDEHWIGGLVYYNPDDPASIVEKRFGVGHTLNFARPIAWLILLLPLVFAALNILVIHRFR